MKNAKDGPNIRLKALKDKWTWKSINEINQSEKEKKNSEKNKKHQWTVDYAS